MCLFRKVIITSTIITIITGIAIITIAITKKYVIITTIITVTIAIAITTDAEQNCVSSCSNCGWLDGCVSLCFTVFREH